MTAPIIIDGTLGEGGGQILRTALAMSLVTGAPFRIVNIRGGRPKPGLMRQHLTSVTAAVQVGQAVVKGDSIGSQELYFAPTTIRPGQLQYAVGTAGSCGLVLQTVLPALVTADGESELILEGGTHNPFAPPFDFLARSFLPLLNRMGPTVSTVLERPGFYPAGGGKMVVSVRPTAKLLPVEIMERGEIRRQTARAMVARLPRAIGERELSVIAEKLRWDRRGLRVEEIADAPGPGNALILEIESEHITEVFTSFGQRGVPAEQVASQAANAASEYLAAGAPVGRHLADQLLVPMALAGRGKFRTLSLSRHTVTNTEIIKRFLPVEMSSAHVGGDIWEISLATT